MLTQEEFEALTKRKQDFAQPEQKYLVVFMDVTDPNYATPELEALFKGMAEQVQHACTHAHTHKSRVLRPNCSPQIQFSPLLLQARKYFDVLEFKYQVQFNVLWPLCCRTST